MVETFFKRSCTIHGLRQGPLAGHIDLLANHLAAHGFSRVHSRIQLRLVGHFNRWLEQKGIHNFRTVEWPEQVPVPEIYYDPRSLSLARVDRAVLHAKCIVVDGQETFISSANFTEAAQQRNIEIGVLLRSIVVAERLIRFFDTLVNESQSLRAN